jgi:hypothetical protein
VSAGGVYHIAFAASSVDDAALGSVAIANVQLESSSQGTATTYTETSASRTVVATNCPRSSADLRALFVHQCDAPSSCYYDLSVPIVIDTEALRDGSSPLVGRVAQGNVNFRHVTAAINLAGTGVRDCSATPTPACYGTGYVEYSLRHEASAAGILDWNSVSRPFDFGTAIIEHGKALAAERYITMPLSAADQSLITQPGIEKEELRGRPLDGTYRLRIWDTPALKWDRLTDVQVIVKYRYWSQILDTTR